MEIRELLGLEIKDVNSMIILHYSLGFPPYRSGGLTKFCMDLMKQQVAEGHKVALMWPGKMGFISKKVDVKPRKNELVDHYSIQSFEVINPLPVSFDEGISLFDLFTEEGPETIYLNFFKKLKPDVIHIHTLMGLHKSFLVAAKKMKIRIVFTAHDFFPICPKVTLFRRGSVCESADSCVECGKCNATALGIRKIKILQSPVYRMLKDFPIVKKLRKQHRDNYLSARTSDDNVEPVGCDRDFKRLRDHYKSMLLQMDVIHYNSSVTEDIYGRFFGTFHSKVIGITHGDIGDHRKIKKYSTEQLRIRYLGPYGEAKGFFFLKEVLDKLWNERKDFCLDVHFIPNEVSPYIRTHDRYRYTDLESIFDETDVLIAPSILYETFGYTVLEALSFGVPVIITSTVGAKDILVDGAGVVINDTKSEELYEVLKSLHAEKLRRMNKVIVEKQKILKLEEMVRKIEEECYGW